jgi:glucosamine--fructose-6-phosphate aminotransferase (isomerizing)
MEGSGPKQAWNEETVRVPKEGLEKGCGMLDDILATPDVLQTVIKEYLKADGDSHKVDFPTIKKPFPQSHAFAGKTALDVMAACLGTDGSYQNKITIIGSGTSWHVALLAEYLIEHIARIPVEVTYASEYRYKNPLHRKGDVLIVVSSSGETSDTVASVQNLKKSSVDVLTLAVVNEEHSRLANDCDACITTLAGKEAGTASTKVFSATTVAFVLLAIELGNACGKLAKDQKETLLSELLKVPEMSRGFLQKEVENVIRSSGKNLHSGDCKLWDISCQNVLATNFICLGRGFNFPIALEGAVKCKEVAFIHAEGYPAAEMKHGPIALIDQWMPVIIIAPQSDPSYEKIRSNMEEVKARSGCIIAITDESNTTLDELAEYVIKIPSTHEYLVPLFSVLPLQLLATMMGILRCNQVDSPPGLQKTVSSQSPAMFKAGK